MARDLLDYSYKSCGGDDFNVQVIDTTDTDFWPIYSSQDFKTLIIQPINSSIQLFNPSNQVNGYTIPSGSNIAIDVAARGSEIIAMIKSSVATANRIEVLYLR
jgi:hypothetical protein